MPIELMLPRVPLGKGSPDDSAISASLRLERTKPRCNLSVYATLKMRMGATHFLMKRLPNVATEMALNVLSYNLTRVLNIVGFKPLLAAMRA